MNPVITRPSLHDIRRRLASRADRPALPPCGDPAWQKWTGRADLARLAGELRRRALEEAEEPLPGLPEELYREFHERGTRDGFQTPYFERRRRLGRAAIARLSCAPEDEARLTRSLADKLRAIMDEDSWALPAHVRNATGRDRFCIDLASAETANLAAECACVFASVLPGELRDRILGRLREEYFDNYLAAPGQSVWWRTATNNWNAVCHHGVAGAALAIEDDLDRVAALVLESGRGLGCFLEGFTPDGGCSEGPDYWGYGFGGFAALNERLEARSGGELSLFDGDARMTAIARYAPALSLAGGHIVNFSDAKDLPLASWLLGYLGDRLAEKACRRQGAANADLVYRAPGRPAAVDGFNDLFAHWHRVFRFAPPPFASDDAGLAPDVLLPDLGVWVARGRDDAGALWELAAKAGHNDEHHNHNDVGSFILNIDGVPFITEIGAPEYVKDYFVAERRYGFLAARSLGHSVPVVNGHEQPAGRRFGGAITRADCGGGVVEFCADLSGSYPEEAGLRAWERRLALDKGRGALTWEDRFSLSAAGEIESALIVDAPEVARHSATEVVLRKQGVSVVLRALPGAVWDRVEAHAFRDHWCVPRQLSRLVLKPVAPSAEVCLCVLVGRV